MLLFFFLSVSRNGFFTSREKSVPQYGDATSGTTQNRSETARRGGEPQLFLILVEEVTMRFQNILSSIMCLATNTVGADESQFLGTAGTSFIPFTADVGLFHNVGAGIL